MRWLPAVPLLLLASLGGGSVAAQTVETSFGLSGSVQPVDDPGSQALDARLWLRRGETRFGAGIGLARSVWAREGDPSERSLVLGVRHGFGEGADLYADAQRLRQEDGRDGRVRVGLEFKRAPSAFAGLRSGSLLRLQLSADANLSLRPRRGGLAVTYRAQF